MEWNDEFRVFGEAFQVEHVTEPAFGLRQIRTVTRRTSCGKDPSNFFAQIFRCKQSFFLWSTGEKTCHEDDQGKWNYNCEMVVFRHLPGSYLSIRTYVVANNRPWSAVSQRSVDRDD